MFFAAAAANFSLWVQTTITRTDDFVEAFGSLPEDASVAELLGQKIADAAIDPQQAASDIAGRLPDELQPLAAPVATALNELAASVATRLVESDGFDAVWERTLRVGHAALIDLLDLRKDVRALVVDVSDAADQLSQQLETVGITITVPDTPSMTLISAGQSSVTVNALRFIYSTGWVFPALFLALVVAIVLVGPNRRRMVSLVGLVTATAMVFDLVLMRILRTEFGEQVSSGLAANAVHSAWDDVTSRLKWQTWLVLALGVIVWALAHYMDPAARSALRGFPSPATVAFLERWGSLVVGAVIVLGLLVLLLVPSMTFGLALLAALVVAGVVTLISWAKRQPADLASSDPASLDE